MNKLLIICGPTATGKTTLGIKLAKKLDGEIVSADSRQVYKGMDIGTGKDIGNSKFKIKKAKLQGKIQKEVNSEISVGVYEINKIPIWGLDLVEPNEEFSVAYWAKFANLIVKDIWDRKKLPIIVGGTGFWIKALIEGVDLIGIPPNWKLRKKLSNYQIIKLSNLLKKLDPERQQRMNESDKKNPRRLIRAIEITRQSKKSKVKSQKYKLEVDRLLMVGLKADNKVLYERIDRRVDERVKTGVEREIKSLLKAGYSFENSVLGTTIGYKEWRSYLENSKHHFEESKLKEEVIQRWKFAEHAYARRQMTWFKKNKKIKWFEITKPGWQKDVVKLITRWYSDIDA